VAKSPDLAAAGLLIVGLLCLAMLGGGLVGLLVQITRAQLGGKAWLSADTDFAVDQYMSIVTALGSYLLPILGLLFLAGVAAHMLQTGLLFLPDRLVPDIGRLDPIRGLRRMFSLGNTFRVGLGLAKIFVITGVAGLCIYTQREAILSLGALDPPELASSLIQILLATTMKVAVVLLVLGVLDYGFQRWKYEQDLKMTPQELREELKTLQTDPQLASRRRQVQRQLAVAHLVAAVPRADLVLTSPGELAVAIQYRPESMSAPIVVAKGSGALAGRIRQLALQHRIAMVDKRRLARAVYHQTDVNQPIAAAKYGDVAELLAQSYQRASNPTA